MKFLIDMPLSPSLAAWLDARGHDAVHAVSVGMSRAEDSELVHYALSENRIIVTADLDFAQAIALSHAQGPALILFRGGNYSEREMRELLSRVLDLVPPVELTRSVTVVDRSRIRRTSLPLRHSGHEDDT